MKGEHPIRMLCELLGVAPSGYYRARQQQPSPRQREDVALTAQITAAHQASRGTYLRSLSAGRPEHMAWMQGSLTRVISHSRTGS